MTSAWYRGGLLLFAVSFGAVNALVFVGGAFSARLDAIANFAPLLLAVGLLAVALASVARARGVALFALAVAVLPPAVPVVLDLSLAGQTYAARPTAQLKVMTFNIWSKNDDLASIEALVRSEMPDILFLQEASSKHKRQLLDTLERIYPTHVSNHATNCATHLFTTYPLIEHLNRPHCDLVSARLRLPAELGSGTVLAAGVHVSRGNPVQEAAIRDHMDHWADQSAIVGGDFNRTPWSWALRRFDNVERMSRRTRSLPTWPTPLYLEAGGVSAPLPLLPLDHVYATVDWETTQVRRGPIAGSDHFAVIVELARVN